MLIVGVDCATVASKTGLALAEYHSRVLTIKECLVAHTEVSVANQILPWVRHVKVALLALDSPLGWPAAMGNAIAHHKAGAAMVISAKDLFRRRTDEVVRTSIGKAPLEVGADRIARTALSALSLVKELGVLTRTKISLAWTNTLKSGIYCIEVYPAGTLRSYERMGYVAGSGETVAKKKALLKRMIREGKISLDTACRVIPSPSEPVSREGA
jgi:predicted RNase H-like nuclease